MAGGDNDEHAYVLHIEPPKIADALRPEHAMAGEAAARGDNGDEEVAFSSLQGTAVGHGDGTTDAQAQELHPGAVAAVEAEADADQRHRLAQQRGGGPPPLPTVVGPSTGQQQQQLQQAGDSNGASKVTWAPKPYTLNLVMATDPEQQPLPHGGSPGSARELSRQKTDGGEFSQQKRGRIKLQYRGSASESQLGGRGGGGGGRRVSRRPSATEMEIRDAVSGVISPVANAAGEDDTCAPQPLPSASCLPLPPMLPLLLLSVVSLHGVCVDWECDALPV